MSPEKQKIIQAFLKCPANKSLLDEFRATHSEETKILIDLNFKKFYQNFRILSYLIKVLHYESRHFDKKMRSHRNRYPLSITGNLEMYQENSLPDSIQLSENIVDHISSNNVFNCLRKLTRRQQEILSLVYVRQMTDKEVGQHLGITQQAVSKAKRNALKNMREELTYVR